MGKRSKIPSDVNSKYAKLCFEGELSHCEAARILGVHHSAVREWAIRYEMQGELAFLDVGHNNIYTEDLKMQAVQSYLKGEGSYSHIAARYGLRSTLQLRQWVKMYNNGEDFSHKMSGGSRMKTSRETTQEERVRITKECLANGKNYGEIAIKYNVSYQQVYSWVKRYTELGEAGLEDRRGKRKVSQDPRNEVEKLQIELEQLKHKLYMTEMERDLLKKVEELERKDRCRK